MRVVVQRVSRAKVTVADEITGEIGPGLLVLLGVEEGDTEQDCMTLAKKTAGLRIFEDQERQRAARREVVFGRLAGRTGRRPARPGKQLRPG